MSSKHEGPGVGASVPNFPTYVHSRSGAYGDQGPPAVELTSKTRPDSESMRSLVRANLRARRIRNRHLPDPLFGEPAWDMLLALYLSAQGGSRQTISRLGKISGSPMTTALRWLDYLVRAELVARRTNPIDRRVAFVELTDKGLRAIEAYLTELISEDVAA